MRGNRRIPRAVLLLFTGFYLLECFTNQSIVVAFDEISFEQFGGDRHGEIRNLVAYLFYGLSGLHVDLLLGVADH